MCICHTNCNQKLKWKQKNNMFSRNSHIINRSNRHQTALDKILPEEWTKNGLAESVWVEATINFRIVIFLKKCLRVISLAIFFFFSFLYYPLMCHLISAIWKRTKLECILVFFYFSLIYIPIILVPSAILELSSFLAQCNFFSVLKRELVF